MLRLITAIMLTTLILSAWRCTFGSVDGPPRDLAIEQLMRDPGPHDGHLVRVRGLVLERVSLLGAGGFRLAAGPGESLLVLGLGTAPQPGESATVTGIFRVAAAVGPYQAPVILVR